MLLSTILNKTGVLRNNVIGRIPRVNVKYGSSDSRLLFPDSIFLMRRGKKYNAFDFFPQVKDKVSCFAASIEEKERVAELGKKYPDKTFILVNDLGEFSNKLSDILFRQYRGLKIIGITGTNGKTTTAYLVNSILNSLGLESALLSTVKYSWQGKNFPSFMTTLDNFMLKSLLCRIKDDGVKYVVSEISSHGLANSRVKDISLQRAVFTNLSQDHLDFHKNMKGYLEAKKNIFRYLGFEGKALINVDDKRLRRFFRFLRKPKLSFSINQPGDYKIRGYRFKRNGLEFLISLGGRNFLVKAPMLGLFNVYNVLASFSLAHSLGLDTERIIEAISVCKAPPGRLEKFKQNVFVDYAHTPSALKEAIFALRDANYRKVVVVFGCGGERDKLKRPRMGKVVSKYADYGIITSDNPRKEDPYRICKAIEKGMAKGNYTIILDRREAVKKGLGFIKKDTAILIAGKGHEVYQDFGEQKVKFSDRYFIRRLLG